MHQYFQNPSMTPVESVDLWQKSFEDQCKEEEKNLISLPKKRESNALKKLPISKPMNPNYDEHLYQEELNIKAFQARYEIYRIFTDVQSNASKSKGNFIILLDRIICLNRCIKMVGEDWNEAYLDQALQQLDHLPWIQADQAFLNSPMVFRHCSVEECWNQGIDLLYRRPLQAHHNQNAPSNPTWNVVYENQWIDLLQQYDANYKLDSWKRAKTRVKTQFKSFYKDYISNDPQHQIYEWAFRYVNFS